MMISIQHAFDLKGAQYEHLKGHPATSPRVGGPHRRDTIEAYRNTVLALYGARRDITLDELRGELGQGGDGGELDAAPLLRPA